MLNHPPNYLANRLGLDILNHILFYLDPCALASFSETCRLFRDTVRRELSFETAVWHHHEPSSPIQEAAETNGPSSTVSPQWRGLPYLATKPTRLDHRPPPVFHSRCLAKIGRQLYMPFMATKPICYVYDIDENAWTHYTLHSCTDYTPFVAPVVAVGARLYMFGGRKIASAMLSDEVHVIDTESWSLKRLDLICGPSPTPRRDHTVDVLENRYLLVFGGVCSSSLGENDLKVFDTITNTWTEPRMTGQIPSVRYGHASAMCGYNLYIFGGCETRAEGHLVHDTLYRLDCTSWTWHKYDYPEAYSYRRSHYHSLDPAFQQDQQLQAMATLLRRNLVVETTGHPPHDRFHCILQPVGQHKLLVFGGHTVRQDNKDHNVLHAHSLRSIDVFDLKRNHWSAITTSSSVDGAENSIYPQDISAFLIQGNRLLVIGQQKIFTAHAESSGEYSDYFGSPPVVHHLQSSPVESLQQQQGHQRARNQSVPRKRHFSPSIADYEEFLDPIVNSEDEEDSNQGPLPIDGMLRSIPTVANSFLLGTTPDETQQHVNRQYTLEPLCIQLSLNRA